MPPEESIEKESLSDEERDSLFKVELSNKSDVDVSVSLPVRERMLDTFPLTEVELDLLLHYFSSYSRRSSTMSLSVMLTQTNLSRTMEESLHIERLCDVEKRLLPESAIFLEEALKNAFVIGCENDEPSTVERFKFLEAIVSLLGRRGSRTLLQILFNVATVSTDSQEAQASKLVDLVHRLILASQDLKSDDDERQKCQREESVQSIPLQSWINSLIERSNGTDMISMAKWNDWVNSVAPQVYQSLSTYVHYALFMPNHPFRSTCPPLSIPKLDSESVMWKDESCNPLPLSLAMLSPDLGCGNWNRLYSSDVDASSFPTFQHALLGYHGPTVMLIKTVKGDIFGYYTTCPWKVSNNWFGQEEGGDSFLFGIKPTLQYYGPQGVKPYHMYLNTIATTRSDILKGLAIGGINESSPRIHITPNFENCKAASIDGTYSCGSVLSDHELFFDIDVLEVWAVSSCVEEYEKSLQGGKLQNAIREGNRIKAAQVDRKQFLEDFQSGQYANKLFLHRDQARGRHSFVVDDEGNGYFIEDNPPTPKGQQVKNQLEDVN